MSDSGIITAVIHIGDCLDEASVVAVFGNREREAPGVFSDVEWFEEEKKTMGLVDMLDLDELNGPITPGFWLVQGYFWSEYSSTVNGADWDGGFEIERFDMLPTDPVEAVRLVYSVIRIDGGDAAVVEGFLRCLFMPDFRRQDSFTRFGNLLGALTVVRDLNDFSISQCQMGESLLKRDPL